MGLTKLMKELWVNEGLIGTIGASLGFPLPHFAPRPVGEGPDVQIL